MQAVKLIVLQGRIRLLKARRSSTCSACTAGTYSIYPGVTSIATCLACPAGTYSTVLGAASSASCSNCAAGTYSSAVNAVSISTCSNCVAGTYSTALGAESIATCSNCLSGKYSSLVCVYAAGAARDTAAVVCAAFLAAKWLPVLAAACNSAEGAREGA